MHVAHCDRTSTEEGEKKQEKCFCENPSKVVSCHQFISPSKNGPPVNGPFTVRFPLSQPFPSHSYDTHLPAKLPFKENKREDRKKRKWQ